VAQTINTNISSLTAQRNSAKVQDQLATSMARLSSGLRINSARDDAAGLAGKTSAWIPEPARYILMYEPPAGSMGCAPDGDHEKADDLQYHFWHYSGDARSDVARHDIPNEGRRFLGPLLFVDGHAGFFDFTQTIRADADFICEPTMDWIWYKPKSD